MRVQDGLANPARGLEASVSRPLRQVRTDAEALGLDRLSLAGRVQEHRGGEEPAQGRCYTADKGLGRTPRLMPEVDLDTSRYMVAGLEARRVTPYMTLIWLTR